MKTVVSVYINGLLLSQSDVPHDRAFTCPINGQKIIVYGVLLEVIQSTFCSVTRDDKDEVVIYPQLSITVKEVK